MDLDGVKGYGWRTEEMAAEADCAAESTRNGMGAHEAEARVTQHGWPGSGKRSRWKHPPGAGRRVMDVGDRGVVGEGRTVEGVVPVSRGKRYSAKIFSGHCMMCMEEGDIIAG